MSSDEDNFSASDSESGSDFEVAPKAAITKKAPVKAVAAKVPAKEKKPAAKKSKKGLLGSIDGNLQSESESDAMQVDPAPPKKTAKKPAPANANKNASDTYQKLSQLEHVLKRPDTYIGSVEATTQLMWVFDKASSTMVQRQVTYVPGLYKIFDEILVNAADNKQNDKNMTQFKVTIDKEKGSISVYNNGAGIPVEIHSKEGIYIPELIFGTLLTSSNYDDDQKKTTGGRNGYGAKLTNIYSKSFTVETADRKNGLKFKMTWSNNMGKKTKPSVTDNTKEEEYTKVTFEPDFERFGMDGLDDDTEALMIRRVYDMAGTVKDVKVHLNGSSLSAKIKGFGKYVEMYANAAKDIQTPSALVGASPTGAAASGNPTILVDSANARWEVAFAPSDGQFQQVSFVNNIATAKGGTHVEHVAKAMSDAIAAVVEKKNKASKLKPHQIKQHMWIFVNCLIENPSFDSQTKEHMTLQQSKFGSKYKLSEDFAKKIIKSGVVDNILSYAKFKQDQDLKRTDGKKRTKVTGISKLEDANKAGTKEGYKCTLILTEGDSAKALAVAGIGHIGRDYFGVFPLRGKLLNVREATGKSLTDNAEIQALKQIMGLQHQKVYKDTQGLRYGHIMIMTDQDHDGSHIKGLIINFLDHFFPSLLRCTDFLVEFVTPIVKVTKGKKEKTFFTLPEYENWKEENVGGRGWISKYYKGLGTSTAADAKKYFSDMQTHRLVFDVCDDEDRKLIDMAFSKKRAEDRKEWLRSYVPGTFLDHSIKNIPMTDFINKELVLFSLADCARSIPSVVDGFKPGQRKVIFGCFKRKLKKEIKVAQLGGYVAEHSAYHHGEVSLTQTIVGLAQDFVGSNNLNLLEPNGQFGTRLAGGKDAASPRYIFTNLSTLTRRIFHPADDALLTYLNDDGQSIEPEWYLPILPMILVNGSDGIGTGWSSSIPNYNPIDIVDNIKRKLNGEEVIPMEPWYRGFDGSITKSVDKSGEKFICCGIHNQPDNDTLKVTELPIRSWTQSYKENLEVWSQVTDKQPHALVKEFVEHHTDTTVNFTVQLTGAGKDLIKKDGAEKTFKLSTAINVSNMVCFDVSGKIKKYASPEAILDDFFDLRLDYYHRRKAHLLEEMTFIYEKLSNQARFVIEVITDQLKIAKRKKADIVADMRKRGYKAIPKAPKKADERGPEDADADHESEEEVSESEALIAVVNRESDFDYCLNMPLSSLTKERLEKLENEKADQQAQIDDLAGRSAKELWIQDLDDFIEEWTRNLEAYRSAMVSSKNTAARGAKGKGKTKASKIAAYDSDESDDYVAAAPRKKSPVPKKTATKPKAKTASQETVSTKVDALASESDATSASAAIKQKATKKRSPKPAARQPAKRQKKAVEESDEESDEDIELGSDGSDEDSEDVFFTRPTTKRTQSKAAAKALSASVSSAMSSEEQTIVPSQEDSVQMTVKPAKKAGAMKARTAKPKAVLDTTPVKAKSKAVPIDVDSESDKASTNSMSLDDLPKRDARNVRGAANKASAYKEINLSDSDGEFASDSDDGSDFE